MAISLKDGSLFQKTISYFNPVTRARLYYSDEEKRKREEEERKRREWRATITKESGIPTMEELFTKAKEKAVEVKEKAADLITKPAVRTQFKEEVIKPSISKQYTRENVLAALDPSKYLQGAFKQFIYQPETGQLFPSTIIRDFNEITKLPVGSPERLAKEIRLGTTMAYFLSSAPQAKGAYPRTTAEARKILNVGKKATQEEVKQAATKLLTKEFPEHIKSLASQYKVNEANLIWRAADRLWKGVVPKPLLTAGEAVTGKVGPQLPVTAAVKEPIPIPKPIPVAPVMPVEGAVGVKPTIIPKELEPLAQGIVVQDNLGKITDKTYHLKYISIPKELQRQGIATNELKQRLWQAQKQGAEFFTVRGMTETGKKLINRLEKVGVITKEGSRPGVYRIVTKPQGVGKAEPTFYKGEGKPAGFGKYSALGEGIYSTPDKTKATQYGKVREVSREEIPKNPMRVRYGNLVSLYNKVSDTNTSLNEYVQNQGFDGLQVIEDGKIMEQVKYTPQPKGIEKIVEEKVEIKPKTITPKLTIRQIEKEATTARFKAFLDQSKNQEEYVKRINALSKQLDRPEVKANKKRIKEFRALINKELEQTTGYKITGYYKTDFAVLQTAKEDPEIAPSVEALENFILKADEITSNRIKKEYEVVAKDLKLPVEGKYFIPYGKYTTRGTGNREWIQQNNPLLYMGNKRGMLGYIIDILGIKQTDLGSIVEADVQHLSGIKNVVDLFGGSGLLSNLSKKFFPQAKINYNELDPSVLKAINNTQKRPHIITRFVSEIALWLNRNPGADWLSHFNTVYKGNEDFITAAKLINAAAGRTAEVTSLKLRNLIKAIPNFSNIFKDITLTNKDALGLIDQYIKSGTSHDFLWIDPPYLWSTGYKVGTEMEKAEGFVDLLDKLRKLNNKGVKFVFFNNDPEVQVSNAGKESIHLDNIIGKINQLSEEGTIVLRGVDPVGAAKRREIMITNLEYGLETGRLLILKEVNKAIELLRDDPAAGTREVLKMLRDIRGTSKFAPEAESISPRQIKILRAMRKNLRIKNREMLPILDELLGDTSMAKMTKEDGIKLREWLQPRNWDIIENKIAQTREMIAQERKVATLGDRFAAKDQELEDKYRVLTSLNKTVEHMENMVATLENLPIPKKGDSKAPGEFVAGIADNLVSEETATKMLGIRTTFHVPLRMIIRIGAQFEKNFNKALQSIPEDLTKEVQKQVMFKQAQAKKYYEGVISDEALKVAKYVQEVADANLALINRIRVARGLKPLVGKDEYITYTLAENIKAAAEFGDKVRFWETRVKGPQDFAVGLFNQDMSAVFKIWAKSSASWLKKNLYMAYMQDRFDALSDVSTRAAQYARTIVELDIFDMLPASEKGLRSSGRVLNEQAGKIMPFKIKLDNPLIKSIQNTTLTQDLKIIDDYLYVPRFTVPSLTTSFLRFFYPAKLAGNIGFGLVNLQQPWHMLPFIGLGNTLHTRATAWTVLLPWNKEYRIATIDALERAGYELDMISGDKVPRFEWQGKLQVVGKILDKGLNGIAYITELLNRVEPIVGVDRYLLHLDKKGIVKTTPEQRFRIGAQFSATINYLYGKGYSPVAQRTILKRVLYTFAQYPINTYNLYHEMYKYAAKDKYAIEFWQNLSREALLPAEITEEFNKLPPISKANFFLIALALTVGPALIYALTRSYSAAQRAYPGIPRISVMPLLTASSQYALNPTDDNKDKMIEALKSTFSLGTMRKLIDAMNIKKYGFVTTASGRPIFIEPNFRNIALTSTFGKSTTEPYEEAYPSFLGKMLGGEREAGEAAKLRAERKDIIAEETKTAVDLLKLINSRASSDELSSELIRLKQEGKLTDNVKEKMKGYLTEQVKGQGPLERSIIGLNDEDQAKFILDKINSNISTDDLARLLQQYKQQGILTDNVKDKLKELLKSGYKPEESLINKFKGFFTSK